MFRYIFHLASVTVLFLALLTIGQFPAQSDSSAKGARQAPVFDATYRSKTARHKVIVYAEEAQLKQSLLAEGSTILAEYDAFSLLSAPAAQAEQVLQQTARGSGVRDDLNVILLRAGAIDTTEGEPQFAAALNQPMAADEQLYLVQMIGPAKDEWLMQLQTQAEIVSYIPNNAYLVRAPSKGFDKLNRLASANFVQWSGVYKPAYKIAPEIALNTAATITVTVQIAKSHRLQSDVDNVTFFATEPLVMQPFEVLNFTNVRMRVPVNRLVEIARFSNVVWIEPWEKPEAFDERQGQIVAGNVAASSLTSPGYLDWLRSHGITSAPNFITDIADSGLDQGIYDPQVLHPDFLNEAGLSRIAYARLLGAGVDEGSTNDSSGHGTLDAAIVGGFNIQTSFPHTDEQGYRHGLGIHPFAKLGITKIFNPEFTFPDYTDMVNRMYADGARVSSNSWGAYNNNYTSDSQLYDALVRDAQPQMEGNQELTVLFASGNRGINFLSTPGTAKNPICVGASESERPGTDGCQLPTAAADDYNSIINFSSGGRTADGRVKPDIVAPGTHIQGAASQDSTYAGSGICGPTHYPDGQTLYTWSSGTSHSTPAVAGGVAIVRQFFEQATERAPSPAMLKALLLNSATYLTGVNANDTLPSVRQGWGLLNLGRTLDNAPRLMDDQGHLFTTSGQDFTLEGEVADPSKPFRVTLVWTDAPGSIIGDAVVNNLDLRVEIDGKTYLGNVFGGGSSLATGSHDGLNNVESVWLPAGLSGKFTIKIIAASIAGDGVPGNNDISDQDFALVAYNAQLEGGGGGVLDAPPRVNIGFPLGGEKFTAGNVIRVTWDASDDKKIESQRVEFSGDGGFAYNTIAILDGKARTFDWRVPAIPTPAGRIKITALDGVNLPVSSISPSDFELIVGPPDVTPPTLTVVSPTKDLLIGGGQGLTIKWKEQDNVGVLQRVIEWSADNGDTFQQIAVIIAPSSGQDQEYTWAVPASLSTKRGRLRLRITDGNGNSALATLVSKIEVWPLPFITDASFDKDAGKNGRLELTGRNFRDGETEVFANGLKVKKLSFSGHCDAPDGTCRNIVSEDKKIHKRVPKDEFTTFVIKLPKTGQISPEFRWKRKK